MVFLLALLGGWAAYSELHKKGELLDGIDVIGFIVGAVIVWGVIVSAG